ncbi:MAG: hypothetical protein Q7U04_13965, partial [Bacteriovorax sp.]|nr:hypothetical protein [Bacteriovorax sp.]
MKITNSQKKLGAVLIIIVFLSIYSFDYSSKEIVNIKSEAHDSKKLQDNLGRNVLKNKNWSSVSDYSLDIHSLVTRKNAKEIFRLSNQIIPKLVACLKKNFCGMEPRNEQDSYFDVQNTPGHILLKRNLNIMLEALRLYPELQKEIDWDLEEVQKGDYSHFMLKEIIEEPETIENAIGGRLMIEEGRVKLGGLDGIQEKLRKINRIILVACGTANYA